MRQDKLEDIPALRAEGQTDSELVCPLANEIRNNAIESEARQQQRQERKGVEQDHREPLRRQRAGDHLVHGLRSRDDTLLVVVLDHTSNGIEGRRRSLVTNKYQDAGRKS